MVSELGPPEEEMPLGDIEVRVGASSGKMAVPDRDCEHLSDDVIKKLYTDNIGEFPVPQSIHDPEVSWETYLKSRLTESGNTWARDTTLPKVDMTVPETKRDITKFESFLQSNNIGVSDQACEDAEWLKSFLRSLAQDFRQKYDMKKHIYQRMIWITDHSCINQTAALKAFALCSCMLPKGEYKGPKTYCEKKKSELFLLKDLLGTDLRWSDEENIFDTKKGFNRDVGEFERLLSKEFLSLDRDNACFKAMENWRISYYMYLNSIATVGQQNGMPLHVYRRMMVVICRSYSWHLDDVLKAFFMSMISYKRDTHETDK